MSEDKDKVVIVGTGAPPSILKIINEIPGYSAREATPEDFKRIPEPDWIHFGKMKWTPVFDRHYIPHITKKVSGIRKRKKAIAASY